MASILLLFILLFSLFGYRLLISSLVAKADKEMEARLDDNSYDDSQLISFKVPITLSYYNPSPQWERIEGSIEIGNVYYKYVKRRMVDDSLEVLCIPNSTATKLLAVKRQGTHPVTTKVPVPEPYEVMAPCGVAALPYTLLKTTFYFSVHIPSHPRGIQDRPPALPA
jgi:hypothetical protein